MHTMNFSAPFQPGDEVYVVYRERLPNDLGQCPACAGESKVILKGTSYPCPNILCEEGRLRQYHVPTVSVYSARVVEVQYVQRYMGKTVPPVQAILRFAVTCASKKPGRNPQVQERINGLLACDIHKTKEEALDYLAARFLDSEDLVVGGV